MTTPTKPPQLDIFAYHVDEFELRALDGYDVERKIAATFNIDFDHEQDENDARNFRIVMKINFAEHGYVTEENAPYSIRLTLTGYFTFVDGTSQETMVRMIQVNGSSILFGIARGFVGQATGASRHRQFVLPAVNFIELVNARTKAQSAAGTATEAATEEGSVQKDAVSTETPTPSNT
jgi:preprotein translocase subunit SecB